jgi:hypothetical protein
MMFMIPSVYQSEGAGGKKLENYHPDAEAVSSMMKYNEELAKAGILRALDGLHPASEGTRVKFSGGKASATDGPFMESKEVVGGYWMIEVKSKAEAVEWAKRCPAADGDTIEVRQVFEISEWPTDVQEAAENAVVRTAVESHKQR